MSVYVNILGLLGVVLPGDTVRSGADKFAAASNPVRTTLARKLAPGSETRKLTAPPRPSLKPPPGAMKGSVTA